MTYLPNKDRRSIYDKGLGLIAQNYVPPVSGAGSLMITQRVYYVALGLKKGDVITSVVWFLATIGATSTNLFTGLYDAAGTRLAQSNDLTTAFDATTGFRPLALSAPYTIPADGVYYAAILCVSGGTLPTLWRQASASGFLDTPNAAARAATAQSSQATLPATATFSQAASPLAFWVGVI